MDQFFTERSINLPDISVLLHASQGKYKYRAVICNWLDASRFWARHIYWTGGGGNSSSRGEESGGSLGMSGGSQVAQPLSMQHRLLEGPETHTNSLMGAGQEDEVFLALAL